MPERKSCLLQAMQETWKNVQGTGKTLVSRYAKPVMVLQSNDWGMNRTVQHNFMIFLCKRKPVGNSLATVGHKIPIKYIKVCSSNVIM